MINQQVYKAYIRKRNMENKEQETRKIIVHKNSCGKPIFDKKGNLAICCGDDLGGDEGEFAQCLECRNKDYTDVGEKQK